MRKPYHLCHSGRGVLAWDVDRRIERSRRIPPVDAPLTEFRELDEPSWFDPDGEEPTCRQVAVHAKLILKADLDPPIVLSSSRRVMAGMHRVCRVPIEGRFSVRAVRFDVDPEPDYVGVEPDELPYPAASEADRNGKGTA